MLVIRIELWPHGNHANKRTLCWGIIRNDGTGTPTMGNYAVDLSRKTLKSFRQKQVWRRGAVKAFPRKRLNAWDLLYRALHNIVGDRNGTSKMAR